MNKYQTAVQEAKSLGIELTKGMKTAEIEAAIAAKKVEGITITVGDTEGDVAAAMEPGDAPAAEAPAEAPAVEGEKVERRGRPVVPGSPRQERLAKYEAKKEAGLEVKRGRPVDENSERFKRLKAMKEKKEAGFEVKRGRPALPKVEATLPAGTPQEVVNAVNEKVKELVNTATAETATAE